MSSGNPMSPRRFEQEAKAAVALNHSNLLTVGSLYQRADGPCTPQNAGDATRSAWLPDRPRRRQTEFPPRSAPLAGDPVPRLTLNYQRLRRTSDEGPVFVVMDRGR